MPESLVPVRLRPSAMRRGVVRAYRQHSEAVRKRRQHDDGTQQRNRHEP